MSTQNRIFRVAQTGATAVFCAFLLAATAPALQAQDRGTVLRDGVPETYVVVRGDTLWGIAGRFLRNPWDWPDIWQVNPEIENPHLIYPGDIVHLVWVDGAPRLRVDRGVAPPDRRGADRLQPQIRVLPLEDAVPTIPLEVIRPFLSRPQVVQENELDDAPYVLRSVDGRLMAGSGNRVYVRGLSADSDNDWTIVRKGQAYRDPVTNDLLGYEAEYVADATIVRTGDPATVVLNSSQQETMAGDRLIDLSRQQIETSLHPRAPSQQVEGHLVARLGGGLQIGQYHVVVINRGESHGLEPGMVLSIWQTGEEMEDTVGPRGGKVMLPDERVGELVVFRTSPQLSYALVMRSARDMSVGDIVRNP